MRWLGEPASTLSWSSAFTNVVFPEPVPPATTMLSRSATAFRRTSAWERESCPRST
jgi:hypothetical protein